MNRTDLVAVVSKETNLSPSQVDNVVESFINKLSQHYANDVIIVESQKIGFQPIKSKQHVDGSNTITLQRWNLNNSISLV